MVLFSALQIQARSGVRKPDQPWVFASYFCHLLSVLVGSVSESNWWIQRDPRTISGSKVCFAAVEAFCNSLRDPAELRHRCLAFATRVVL